MDQIKIGRFIAALRKERKLTQRQLAEQLCISDKTVSKWECGNGLPEVSLMLPLCEILEISVNELLSGERLEQNQYRLKAEENIMNLIKEKEESRKKIIISAVIAMTGVIGAVVNILIASYCIELRMIFQILIVVWGVIMSAVGIGAAVVLDCDTGTFECPDCHERFVPDMKSYIMGAHTLTRRNLTCPNCGKKRFCRRRLTK